MKTATRTTLALLGLTASAIGMAGSAEAQNARLINQCDRLCANNPRAICYATCLGGNGVAAPQAKPRRVQPVSVQSSANPGWLDAVYASPSRAGPSGNGGGGAGGGGGGKGK